MEIGSYKSKQIDFTSFHCTKFVPHLYDPSLYNVGCGASALSLITGIPPFDALKLLKNKVDVQDKAIIKLLKTCNFKVARINKSAVTNFSYLASPIKPYHVILISCLLFKGEASWFVLWQNIMYHNFEPKNLSKLEFLNSPIVSCYLITHSSWKNNQGIKKEKDL